MKNIAGKPLKVVLLIPGLACLALSLVASAGLAAEPVEVLKESQPQQVLAGNGRRVMVRFRSQTKAPIAMNLRWQLLQASSATIAHVQDSPWKELRLFPDQTLLEHVMLEFPDVKAETRFLIRWLEETNRILGTTEVLVYPTNLLAELKILAGEKQIVGVFDPENLLKPLLGLQGVGIEDLAESGIANYRGKLAIIGPIRSREASPGDLAKQIEDLARRGVGVVWVQPSSPASDNLQPSFYPVPFGSTAVVVAQSWLVADLANRPQAQLNLLHLCRRAFNPEPLRLPN